MRKLTFKSLTDEDTDNSKKQILAIQLIWKALSRLSGNRSTELIVQALANNINTLAKSSYQSDISKRIQKSMRKDHVDDLADMYESVHKHIQNKTASNVEHHVWTELQLFMFLCHNLHIDPHYYWLEINLDNIARLAPVDIFTLQDLIRFGVGFSE